MTPSCSDIVWDVAQVMTKIIGQRELTKSFCTPNISKSMQDEMQDALARTIISTHGDNPQLKMLLERHGGDAKSQRALVLDAIHLLGRAYSACSSVYPQEWFAKFRQRTLEVRGENPPSGQLMFMEPAAATAVEAVA